MISLSESHLADQEIGPPSSLVKRFSLEFFKDNTLVKKLEIEENHQRRVAIEMDEVVFCDAIKLTVLETHGTTAPKVFEMRVY